MILQKKDTFVDKWNFRFNAWGSNNIFSREPNLRRLECVFLLNTHVFDVMSFLGAVLCWVYQSSFPVYIQHPIRMTFNGSNKKLMDVGVVDPFVKASSISTDCNFWNRNSGSNTSCLSHCFIVLLMPVHFLKNELRVKNLFFEPFLYCSINSCTLTNISWN